MPLTEKHIRNVFIYIIPRFINAGVGFLTLPILTRILSPKEYGIVVFLLAAPVIFASLFSVGLTSSAQRYYFEYREDKQKLDAFIFMIQLFLYGSLIVSSIGIFFCRDWIATFLFEKPGYGWPFFVSFLTAFLGQIIIVYLNLYQNMERAVVHSFFTVLKALFVVSFQLLFVWYLKMSYMGMIYGTFLGTALICLTMLFHFNIEFKMLIHKRILWENIKYGLQVLPKSFSGFLLKIFDKYMLNKMISSASVGIYGIGQLFENATFMVMGSIWAAFQPAYYREIFDKGEAAASTVGRVFTIFAYVALTPLFMLILFSQEVVQIIAPPSYYAAIDVIMMLLAGTSTQVFGMFIGVQYAYSKKAYFLFPLSATVTIINVILNIILIPRFGLMGAVCSMVIYYFILNGLLAFVGQRFYRIGYEWKYIIPLFCVMMTALVTVYYLRHMEVSWMFFYSIKSLFVILFLGISFRARVLTKNSLQKFFGAFFRSSKVVAMQKV